MFPNYPPPDRLNPPPPNIQWHPPPNENRFRSSFFPKPLTSPQPRQPQRNNFQNKSLELLRKAEAITVEIRQENINRDIYLQDELWIKNFEKNLNPLTNRKPKEKEKKITVSI